jgi:hypothetical protein
MDNLVAAAALSIKTFFALYFLYAIAHKLGDQAHFMRAIAGYALLPDIMVKPVGIILIGLETIAVALLFAPQLAAAALMLMSSLLIVYTAALASVVLRNIRTEDCGCGGFSGGQAVDAWHLQRNACLVCLSLGGALAAQQSVPVAPGATGVGVLLGTVLTILCLSLEGLRANQQYFSRSRAQ